MLQTSTGAQVATQALLGNAIQNFAATPAAVPSLAPTDSIGMILPPSDIRSIVDKTAQFVAKNGLEFEQRVLLDKGGERKFSFLLPGNPYRAYYESKVKEFLTGEVNEATKPQIPQAILEMRRRESEKKEIKDKLLALTAYATGPLMPGIGQTADGLLKLTDVAANLSAPDTRLLAIDDGRPPEPPTEDQFTVTLPFAAALDIDVIKLTAQYVARNGQKFLVGLGQRERGNAQFAFLRATHPLFSYFTALVDAYAKCLVPERTTIARLKEDIGVAGRFSSTAGSQKALIRSADILKGPKILPAHQMNAMLGIFERVMARYRWEDYEERRKHEKAKEEAEDREQMHALDWHEFVVVECIQFTEEDDTLPLGPPIDISQLTQPPMIPQMAPHEQFNMMDPRYNVTTPSPAQPYVPMTTSESGKPVASSTTGNSFGPPPAQTQLRQGGFSSISADSNLSSSVPIMVISDYVRQPKKRIRPSEGMMKCPITGQWIPTKQMSEHLRVLLLDPKWKEQKDILVAKAKKESAFAPESDFEANLANFVVKRPDLFGSIDDECESTYVPPPKTN